MFQVSSLKTHIFNCEHYFQVLYLNRSGSINVQMSCSVLAFATTSEISFLTAQHSGLFCSRYSEFISLTLNKSMFRSVFKHKVREWKIKNNNKKKTPCLFQMLKQTTLMHYIFNSFFWYDIFSQYDPKFSSQMLPLLHGDKSSLVSFERKED